MKITKKQITQRYNDLWKDAIGSFDNGICDVDTMIDDNTDTRRGVTLLFRPNLKVKKQIQLFLSEFDKIESGQYLYPESDIHTTISSIISAHENFSLNQIKSEQYVSVIKQSLNKISPFKIEFTGVTASPSSVIIQGYPLDDQLQSLREQLKKNFHASELLQSIDSRYSLITAHSTVLRFRKKLTQPKKVVDLLQKYREYNFGISDIKKVEFVFNDWYQKKELSPIIESFELNS
jgi:2'-5' RNA ligase